MNLDDYLKEDTLIGEPIEEKPQNEEKEEIKTGGQKSINNTFYTPTTLSSLKDYLVDYCNGGDGCSFNVYQASDSGGTYGALVTNLLDRKSVV